jgi:hypothetical protein
MLALFAALALAAAPSTPQTTRLDAAARAFASNSARFAAGVTDVESVYTWSMRWADAERDVDGAVKAATDHSKRMHTLRDQVADRVKAGGEPASDLDAVAWYVADADLRVTNP